MAKIRKPRKVRRKHKTWVYDPGPHHASLVRYDTGTNVGIVELPPDFGSQIKPGDYIKAHKARRKVYQVHDFRPDMDAFGVVVKFDPKKRLFKKRDMLD